VEYVLEAQALKEARDDPRRRRSSPEILLHDGAGGKRQDFTAGADEPVMFSSLDSQQRIWRS